MTPGQGRQMPGGIVLLVVFVEDKGWGIPKSEICAFSQDVEVDAGCESGGVVRFFIGGRKVDVVIIRLTHRNARGEFVVKLCKSGEGIERK